MTALARLERLVDKWEAVVAQVVRGYDQDFDDWLTDMDLRDRLQGELLGAGANPEGALIGRLRAADETFRGATAQTGPIWGADVAADEEHDPELTWWYFRVPRAPGPQLAEDLALEGLR